MIAPSCIELFLTCIETHDEKLRYCSFVTRSATGFIDFVNEALSSVTASRLNYIIH